MGSSTNPPNPADPLRRPIPQRASLKPNHISLASVGFALLGCACLVLSAHFDDAARLAGLALFTGAGYAASAMAGGVNAGLRTADAIIPGHGGVLARPL